MTELLISSAILITVLAVMRVLFRGRISPGFQYALWLLVLLRLALPFHLLPSPVSAAGAITRAIQIEQADGTEQTGLRPGPDTAVAADRQTDGKPDFEPLLRYAWLGGSLIAAIWFGVVNLKLTLRLRRARRRLRLSAPVPIYVADGLPSPCLYGLFHPAVYLTEQAISNPQRAKTAVAHELTHWRHRDNLWTAARILCLIVYWFDPFVWLAAGLSRQDCELFCDECAIRVLGEEHRFAYGRALLEMSAAAARPTDLICSASTMSGGARRLRERLSTIAHRPARSAPLSAAALIITLVTAACTFSGSTAALEAVPTEITPTSPPYIAQTHAPDEGVIPPDPESVPDTDAPGIAFSTPVPTPTPANTPTPTPALSASGSSAPQKATARETAADDETPSGGETPQTQRAQADDGESSPPQTLPPSEPDAAAEEAATPAATPPTEESEQVVVRDMRDVYMNSGLEPDVDMPSTVPDSPPPAAVPEVAEGE